MNCSLSDSSVTLPSLLQDPQDSEDQGRPYLKCPALLYWHLSFLIIFNGTFNRYTQIVMTNLAINILNYLNNI